MLPPGFIEMALPAISFPVLSRKGKEGCVVVEFYFLPGSIQMTIPASAVVEIFFLNIITMNIFMAIGAIGADTFKLPLAFFLMAPDAGG